MELWRKTLGEQYPNYGSCLNNLAELYRAVGQYDQPEPLYLQAPEIRRATLGEEHPGFAESLSNVAVFYESTGRYDEAERLQEQALQIRRGKLGEAHPSVATSLNNLAALHRATGRHAEAEPCYERALEIRRNTLGDSHPFVAQSLNNLAVLYAATGRPELSLERMQQAADVHRRLIGQVFAISSESRRLEFLQRIGVQYHAFLSLVWKYLSESPAAVAAALDLVLARKGIAAEALALQRDAILAGRYSHCEPDLRELVALRRQIARKTLAGPGQDGSEDHQRTLREWNEQRDALETRLARQIPEMRLQRHLRDVNRQAVARNLPPDAALVEIVRFNVFDFQAAAERLDESHWRPPRQWQPARYLAFVLRAAGREDGSRGLDGDGESPCEMIDLGEAEPIDKLVSGFQSRIVGLDRGLSFGDAKSPDAANEAGRSLRAAVFDPIARRLDDCRRLLLAPDGALSMLPFEVLPTGDGGRLIDDYQISYVTTGRDVLRFGRVRTRAVTEPLVVADPDYDLCADEGAETRESGAHVPSPGRLSRAFARNGTTFQRVRATEKEGQRIAVMLGTQRLWLRDAALDARIKAVRSPRLLHLATHGFFLADRPNVDQDSQGTSGFQSLRQEAGGAWSVAGLENPLLRSGLALAGVNTWLAARLVPAGAEDGILTAEDVTGMDLTNTDLVVLSACETGVGEVRSGEGVFGLRRAFVLAGARTLVMSLWKVPDSQTQELMEAFYRFLQSGTPPADALRQAKLSIREQHPEPYYWGSFICQGDLGSIETVRADVS